MTEERRTIKNWAARLSAEDEPLTLEEARALAEIAATDRLLDILTVLKDLQHRLTRLEVFIDQTVPAYHPTVKRALTGGPKST